MGPEDLSPQSIPALVATREVTWVYSSTRDNVDVVNNPNGNVAFLFLAFPYPLPLTLTKLSQVMPWRVPFVVVTPGVNSSRGGTNTNPFRVEVSWV